MEIIKRPPLPGCILLTEHTLTTGSVYKNSNTIHGAKFWHKFEIFNTTRLNREMVLQQLMDFVHPLDFIPVYFCQDSDISYFLARNCGNAIEKLCKNNLKVPNMYNPSIPFKINILLRFSSTNDVKIDVQRNILQVLNLRYKSTTLDLNSFQKDPNLTEFCPLSQPKIMYFVLHVAQTLKPKKLLMKHNGIKSLIPLETMATSDVWYIDLSHNKIDNVDELKALGYFKKLTELHLTGNPICSQFEDSYNYICTVKKYCPTLNVLDGVRCVQNGLPYAKKNFLCNQNGYSLVSNFVEHYFTIYDSGNRRGIEPLYHKNAQFGVTCMYHIGQITSATARLRHFQLVSRNILQMADLSKNYNNLFKTSYEIVSFLCSLPTTEHDPYTFTTDMTFFSDEFIILTITGVFKEKPDNLLIPDRIMSFTRTFVLRDIDNSFCIVNEQLHVSNALSTQQYKAFLHEAPVRSKDDVVAKTQKDKEVARKAFSKLTTVNQQWSQKFLEQCSYNFVGGLTRFLDMYKANQVPQEAFK